MKRSNVERLRLFYEQFSHDDHVLVLINADPDAIASAMAVKRLLWRKVAEVSISHINVIKRPDNKAMMERLKVQSIHISNIEKKRFNKFVIVDSQPSHNEIFRSFEFNAVIDHHPQTTVSAGFIDIRPQYGATATIMTEYLKAAKIKPSVKLATGLFYAIKTDTDTFKRKTIMEDIRAFQFNFKHANLHLERRIEQAELQPSFLKYFQKAISEKKIRRKRLFIHLNTVENPDICVLIADFFMRLNTINWTIVSGIYKNTLIIIFRNDGLRKNAGKVAELGFGKLGSAGGHKSLARAEIPMDALTREVIKNQNHDTIQKWIMKQIEKKAE